MPSARGYSPSKLKELIVFIARQSLTDRTFGSIKLNKILWYSDFTAFRVLGKSITGARYQNLPEGPALAAMLPIIRELEEEGSIREVPGGAGPRHRKAIALREENLQSFSAPEIGIVTDYIAEFWERSAADVSKASHQTKAWRLTETQQEIPYGMAALSSDEPSGEDLDWLREVAGARLGA